METTTECSPVITLPEDPVRVEQLRAKLEEYQNRVEPSWHPERQQLLLYKIAVLERLLRDGSVETRTFSLELAAEDGKDPYLDVEAFNQACGVIRDYCETGGANAIGGTGLPKVT